MLHAVSITMVMFVFISPTTAVITGKLKWRHWNFFFLMSFIGDTKEFVEKCASCTISDAGFGIKLKGKDTKSVQKVLSLGMVPHSDGIAVLHTFFATFGQLDVFW